MIVSVGGGAGAGSESATPLPEVRRALAPLLAHPTTTAIVTDFDGTLSPIVADPATAQPLDGVPQVLAQLARRFGVVAVVSGRPGSFLLEQLAVGSDHAVQFVGLYGLEWARGDGSMMCEPGVEEWRSVITEVGTGLRSAAPPRVLVEGKGLTVTVHWRQEPDAEGWVTAAVADEVARTGLVAHPGRMSVELRPPLDVDKGSVVRRLVEGCTAACYFGDDLGDLPAFAALAELAPADGRIGVSVAVVDDESAPEVREAADVVVDGPNDALGALRWLAEEAPLLGGA